MHIFGVVAVSEEVVVEEGSSAPSALICTRNAVTENIIIYFQAYDDVDTDIPIFNANDGTRRGEKWTVEPEENDALEYTLSVDPVNMFPESDTDQISAGTYR